MNRDAIAIEVARIRRECSVSNHERKVGLREQNLPAQAEAPEGRDVRLLERADDLHRVHLAHQIDGSSRAKRNRARSIRARGDELVYGDRDLRKLVRMEITF